VKKLLTFLIMLVIGMALFAMPVVGETDTASPMNTVEAVPQFAGAFAAVTDVSPAVMQVENLQIYTNDFEVSVINDNIFNATPISNSQNRQEASPLYGYSETAALGIVDTSKLTPKGRS